MFPLDFLFAVYDDVEYSVCCVSERHEKNENKSKTQNPKNQKAPQKSWNME